MKKGILGMVAAVLLLSVGLLTIAQAAPVCNATGVCDKTRTDSWSDTGSVEGNPFIGVADIYNAAGEKMARVDKFGFVIEGTQTEALYPDTTPGTITDHFNVKKVNGCVQAYKKNPQGELYPVDVYMDGIPIGRW